MAIYARGPSWIWRSIQTSTFLTTILYQTPALAQSNNYRLNAQAALTTLQQWYNVSDGLWDTTGWWNSANCLTILADFAAIDPYAAVIGDLVFPTTLVQAQRYNLQMEKVILDGGMMQTYYADQWPFFPPGWPIPSPVSPQGFLNNYYDDEGWWALAWIRVYDVTGGESYLQAAIDIFDDMVGGWNSSRCGGGIWWDKTHSYENAIANELFLSVAAHLANRVHADSAYYLDWALREWAWFEQSGMINSQYNINDGLTSTCENNGQTVWSYNQGVILGGLVELNKAAPNTSYITIAQAIATAAIAKLTDANGILHDPCEPNCGADGSQFKGIFVRNLQVLQQAAPLPEYQRFIDVNANAIWAGDRESNNELSVVWSGPFVVPANASTQSSALDALVAAVALQ
jgi:hypothetical protein